MTKYTILKYSGVSVCGCRSYAVSGMEKRRVNELNGEPIFDDGDGCQPNYCNSLQAKTAMDTIATITRLIEIPLSTPIACGAYNRYRDVCDSGGGTTKLSCRTFRQPHRPPCHCLQSPQQHLLQAPSCSITIALAIHQEDEVILVFTNLVVALANKPLHRDRHESDPVGPRGARERGCYRADVSFVVSKSCLDCRCDSHHLIRIEQTLMVT
jgi:hypothetical protein